MELALGRFVTAAAFGIVTVDAIDAAGMAPALELGFDPDSGNGKQSRIADKIRRQAKHIGIVVPT